MCTATLSTTVQYLTLCLEVRNIWGFFQITNSSWQYHGLKKSLSLEPYKIRVQPKLFVRKKKKKIRLLIHKQMNGKIRLLLHWYFFWILFCFWFVQFFHQIYKLTKQEESVGCSVNLFVFLQLLINFFVRLLASFTFFMICFRTSTSKAPHNIRSFLLGGCRIFTLTLGSVHYCPGYYTLHTGLLKYDSTFWCKRNNRKSYEPITNWK